MLQVQVAHGQLHFHRAHQRTFHMVLLLRGVGKYHPDRIPQELLNGALVPEYHRAKPRQTSVEHRHHLLRRPRGRQHRKAAQIGKQQGHLVRARLGHWHRRLRQPPLQQRLHLGQSLGRQSRPGVSLDQRLQAIGKIIHNGVLHQ